MGHRLHSAKKYDVQYSDTAAFNYAQNHINPIIEILSENDCYYEGDCLDYADTLEGNRGKLQENVERILTPDNDWGFQEELDELIEYMEEDEDCNIDRQYLYNCLKSMIENSDENCPYVHFAWF